MRELMSDELIMLGFYLSGKYRVTQPPQLNVSRGAMEYAIRLCVNKRRLSINSGLYTA